MQSIGYVRISDPELQDPASQIKLMTDKGISADDIFVDMGSGTIEPSKRPQFKMLIARIEAGGIETLVISEFSRIGRTVDEGLSAILDIRKKGIKIMSLSISEQFINDIPYDLQPMVLGGMMYSASQERKHISERTRWGLQNAREKGTRSGKPIGRPNINIDFAAIEKFSKEKNLKTAQTLRVLGISSRTYYAHKKARQAGEV